MQLFHRKEQNMSYIIQILHDPSIWVAEFVLDKCFKWYMFPNESVTMFYRVFNISMNVIFLNLFQLTQIVFICYQAPCSLSRSMQPSYFSCYIIWPRPHTGPYSALLLGLPTTWGPLGKSIVILVYLSFLFFFSQIKWKTKEVD